MPGSDASSVSVRALRQPACSGAQTRTPAAHATPGRGARLDGVDDHARKEVGLGVDDLGRERGLGAVDQHRLAQRLRLDRQVLLDELARLRAPRAW